MSAASFTLRVIAGCRSGCGVHCLASLRRRARVILSWLLSFRRFPAEAISASAAGPQSMYSRRLPTFPNVSRPSSRPRPMRFARPACSPSSFFGAAKGLGAAGVGVRVWLFWGLKALLLLFCGLKELPNMPVGCCWICGCGFASSSEPVCCGIDGLGANGLFEPYAVCWGSSDDCICARACASCCCRMYSSCCCCWRSCCWYICCCCCCCCIWAAKG